MVPKVSKPLKYGCIFTGFQQCHGDTDVYALMRLTQNSFLVQMRIYEPVSNMRYKLTCANSEDSNQYHRAN